MLPENVSLEEINEVKKSYIPYVRATIAYIISDLKLEEIELIIKFKPEEKMVTTYGHAYYSKHSHTPYIIHIDSTMELNHMLTIISHEVRHVWQQYTGRWVYDREKKLDFWRGKSLKHYAHEDIIEQDAIRYQKKIERFIAGLHYGRKI